MELSYAEIKFKEGILSDSKSSPREDGAVIVKILIGICYYGGGGKFDQNII